jgi:hypothetical protein
MDASTSFEGRWMSECETMRRVREIRREGWFDFDRCLRTQIHLHVRTSEAPGLPHSGYTNDHLHSYTKSW